MDKGSAHSGTIRIFIEIVLQGTIFAGKGDLKKAEAKTPSGAGCHSAPADMACEEEVPSLLTVSLSVFEQLFLCTSTRAVLLLYAPSSTVCSNKTFILVDLCPILE